MPVGRERDLQTLSSFRLGKTIFLCRAWEERGGDGEQYEERPGELGGRGQGGSGGGDMFIRGGLRPAERQVGVRPPPS